MMYQNKFVAVIKCDGKILREKSNNEIFLPYDCEYSVLLKNLNSKRASVEISIDGTDVLDGHSIVIDANSEYELKGFMKGSTVRNKFKFIQKTQQISEHRGDKVADGIVVVKYAFEKPIKKVTLPTTEIHHHHHNTYTPYYYNTPTWNGLSSRNIGSSVPNDNVNTSFYTCSVDGAAQNALSNIGGSLTSDTNNITTRSVANNESNLSVLMENSIPNEDEGITVKGSLLNERLEVTIMNALEEPEVIIFNLKGATEKSVVARPLTVKTMLVCPTCGNSNKSGNNFCSNCGTYLN